MNKLLLVGLLAGSLLAGCAQAPRNVPIEDRAAVPKRPEVKPANTQVASTTASTDGAAAQGTALGTDAAKPSDGGQGVVTHALPMDGEQLASLEAARTTGGAGQGQADGRSPLNDPASVLAQRIILFDYDSATIRDEYAALIEAHATFLKENTGARVILQGHTDERGSREYNLALGQRRAENVLRAFALLGVRDEQIEAVSLGEEKPREEGHDEAAWAQNRRAEIHYEGE